MADRALRCLVVSDFNTQNFAGYLDNDEEAPEGWLAVTGGDTGTILVLDVPRAARGPF